MMAKILCCDLLVRLFNVRTTLLSLGVTSMMSKGLLLIYSRLHCYQNRLNLNDYYFLGLKKHTICVALVNVCDAINTTCILGELRFLMTITS